MTCTLDSLLARVDTLPRLQTNAMRLIEVVSNPDSTLGEIVDTIRYDQSITTQVLRLCNSSYYGLSRQIASIDDAIRFIGTSKVMQMVMAAHTHGLLGKAQEGYGVRPGGLWEHSVGVAIATQVISQHLGHEHCGALFTAGLLHDVGKVVLNEFVADEFSQIAHLVMQNSISFLEAERQVLGFTHPEVAERVAQEWQLPETISRAMRYHHEPELVDPHDEAVDIIHLADAVCLICGVGTGSDGLLYRANSDVMQRYELVESDLEWIGAETVMELKKIQSLFEPTQEQPE
jgi:putative nucleotidyltransferase with HDIG domain